MISSPPHQLSTTLLLHFHYVINVTMKLVKNLELILGYDFFLEPIINSLLVSRIYEASIYVHKVYLYQAQKNSP